MLRLKAKGKLSGFKEGRMSSSERKTEMGRKVGGVDVGIVLGSTSEILAIKITRTQGQMGWTLKFMLYIKSCISVFEAKQWLTGEWWMGYWQTAKYADPSRVSLELLPPEQHSLFSIQLALTRLSTHGGFLIARSCRHGNYSHLQITAASSGSRIYLP